MATSNSKGRIYMVYENISANVYSIEDCLFIQKFTFGQTWLRLQRTSKKIFGCQ